MRIGQKLSIPLGIVVIGNLIAVVLNNGSLFDYIMYVGIFIPIITVLLLIKNPKNKIVSIILLALSCIGVWFGGDTNLVSATLFCFAIYISMDKKTIFIYSGCLLISIILKFTFMGLNIPQLFVILSGSSFIIILYQHYIHPKEVKNNIIFCPKLDSQDLQIAQLLLEGDHIRDIADKVYLTQDAVSKRIGRAKVKMDAKSTLHLVGICQEKGYIKLNVDK